MRAMKASKHEAWPREESAGAATSLTAAESGRHYLVQMFEFVDLFAGIGGFHGALSSLGGKGVLAAEIDPRAAAVYRLNWEVEPVGDVRELAADPASSVPSHSVLSAGFPCQPFSKSGRQLGMAEERGTLFHDIIKILRAHRPPIVFLENVRNIAGPRQSHAWRAVVEGLRGVGYRVSGSPCVFSPHLLPPESGGAAQIRERVYILGTYVGVERAQRETGVTPVVPNVPQLGWDPGLWSIKEHVLVPASTRSRPGTYRLSVEEVDWIDTWNWLLGRLGPGARPPGFPLWSDTWVDRYHVAPEVPDWKRCFVKKNLDFYAEHRTAIKAWRKAHPRLTSFPASRRKFEWQAQDAPRDLWRLLIHFRPSGIRAKKATYAPALVAMGQTSIYGPARRRLTPREAAGLQGFPDDFKFGHQVDSLTYRQLGNAVNLGAARYIFTRYVEENADDIAQYGERGVAVVEAVARWSAPGSLGYGAGETA